MEQIDEFYGRRLEDYMKSVEWAKNQFARILNGVVENWDGDESKKIVDLDDIRIWSDGKGRDQKLILVSNNRNFDEERISILVSLIQGLEELGWVDLDAVEWTTKIGCGFHGIPKEIPEELYKDWEDKVPDDYPDQTHITYAVIQCTDWAS